MYKVVVFVNLESKNQVKGAMFAAGGGRIGNYDSCCFELIGTGQFRPLKGSNPTIGAQGQVEYVREARLEMVCEDTVIKDVVRAMREAHPYETPAYDVIKLESAF
jgi:hypothetical protein